MPRKLADAPKYQQPRAAESPKFQSPPKVHVHDLDSIPVVVVDHPLSLAEAESIKEEWTASFYRAEEAALRFIQPNEVHPPLIPPPSGALHDGGRVVLDACVIAVAVTLIAVMLYAANGWYQHTGYSPQELCQVRYGTDCTVKTIDSDVTIHVSNGYNGKRYYTISTPSSTAHP